MDISVIVFFALAAWLLVWMFWPETPRPKPKKKILPKITKQIKQIYSGRNELDAGIELIKIMFIMYFLLRLFERFGL